VRFWPTAFIFGERAGLMVNRSFSRPYYSAAPLFPA
jgi:hypothetical protein